MRVMTFAAPDQRVPLDAPVRIDVAVIGPPVITCVVSGSEGGRSPSMADPPSSEQE